ncbi:hypothetical protein BAL199_17273 [alpha proteobacterium BAL199]|jgi:hypothetical protein|nr:hypothetical protein BAL199_17273 [alpha proteobacterium BAL199]
MSRFDDLLANPHAARRYLVVVEPFDPALGTTRTLRYSDHGFVTRPDDTPPNTWFDPRLVTALNFERQLFSGGRLEGRSVPGFGTLTLNNADGGLDNLAGMAWDGRRVRVWLGGDGFRLAEFGLVFDGTADQIEFDDLLVAVRLRDLQARFEAEVTRASYAGTGGTEGREGLTGRARPLCFGQVLRVPAVLVDPAALLYQVHDGAIADVDAVYDRGVALNKVTGAPTAGQFRSDPATGCFTLGASPAGTVTADVRGDATGGYVETAAALVRRVAISRAGFADPEDLDAAAFEALDAAAPVPVGLFVETEAPLVDLLDTLVEAIGGHYGFDRAGRLTVGRVEAPAAAADAEFDSMQILEIERVAVARPIWRQKLGYARYWRTLDASGVAGSVNAETRADLAEGFRYATADDPAIKVRHLLAEEAVRDTVLALATDAASEAARRLALFGADRDALRVRLKTQPFALDLGLTVRIRYPRYGLAAGRNLLVVGMTEDAAVNEVTLDLWG